MMNITLPTPDALPSFDLPVVGADPHERADAARNRRRILEAAEKLFAENGVSCTSMDAIAAEAGVGKGTLFRRFGDRASLARALLSERDSAFQEAFIRGAPPLGPGAPPAERLVAFGEAMLDLLERHGDLLLVAEGGDPAAQQRSDAWAAYLMHVRTLVADAAPDLDEDVCAGMLLAALSARTSVELKVISGKRSVSKKSGAERCAARFSSLTAIESAATEPARRSVPSSAAVSVAS